MRRDGWGICGATLTLLLLVLYSQTVWANAPEPPAITSFQFEVQYNPGKLTDNIVADIYGDTLIVGIIPFQQATTALVATFQTESAETVKVNGVDQVSTLTPNDFSSTRTYVLTSASNTRSYKVMLVYTGLPLVYLYTQNAAPINSKEVYVNGSMKIYPNSGTTPAYTGAIQIRGRGNTTWTLDKKPYRIKLGTAASILGMPSDRDWVLLANHSDKTLMRNSLAYYLGDKMNFAYTPRTQHVDVVLNGVFQGNYLIGEHIKVDKDRVAIEEMDETDIDGEKITGGYFLELDDYRDGFVIELASGLPFVVKDPEDMPQVQVDYIRNYMQQTEDAIFSADFARPDVGYAKYIEPETFIEYYWVQEVLKNIDGRDGSSIFYYKDRGQKLKMGPLWDLDVAAGNASVLTGEDPKDFYVRESKWFKRLFEDPEFRRAAEARWTTLRKELLAKVPQVIDSFATKLELSQRQNFYKWNVLDQIVWPSPTKFGSYAKEVSYLRDWMIARIAWIDANMLGVPVLHSPTANETVTTLSPTLRWRKANLAAKYDLQVSTASNFETLVINRVGVTDTTFTTTEALAENGTYYWRVRAGTDAYSGNWSEVRAFTAPVIIGLGETEDGIALFPNPTSSELFINVPSHLSIGNAQFVDALGRITLSKELQPGSTTSIDVSTLHRGMYVVILNGGTSKPLTRRILLR